MPTLLHSALTGADATHQWAYKQSTDPGAVGAGKGWIDTSAGPPYQLNVRNAGNSAWESMILPASGSVGQSISLVNSAPYLAAPAAPSLTAVSGGGSLAAGTYQVETTYVNAQGETVASSASSITTTGSTSTITIASPPASGVNSQAATGWYAYVTLANGSTFSLQQVAGSPTAIGTNYTLSTGPGSSGAAPSLTNTAGTATATWTSTGGTVTSVALAAPAEFAVSGSPVTGTGTLTLTKATQSANRIYAGPSTGAAAQPGFRALVVADVPSLVASGASHAAGVAPDPGSTAGTTRFLREDATWQVPPGSGGGGTGGSGVPVANALAADVSATSANTWYDGPSVTLAAGTWFLSGQVTLTASGSCQVAAKLWDGSTGAGHELDAGGFNFPGSGEISIPLSGQVTLTGSTTLKLSGACDNAGRMVVKANPTSNAATIALASALVAVPVFGYSQSATSPGMTTGDTITTSGITVARVTPTAAVTGIILQAGTYAGQQVWVANEGTSANTITFAAAATSNVADGVSAVIAGLKAFSFVWVATTNRWYRSTS